MSLHTSEMSMKSGRMVTVLRDTPDCIYATHSVEGTAFVETHVSNKNGVIGIIVIKRGSEIPTQWKDSITLWTDKE